MEVKVYNKEGKEAGTTTLPEQVFGVAWNADLVHRVVTAMRANARAATAHTKDRSEVRGGGKKPWRQKGTGRARHGSRRSPIWTGGGVTHGPRSEKDYTQKINKKARAKALGATLSRKLADSEVVFVDALSFDAPTTKGAKTVLDALASIEGYKALAHKRQNAALVVLPARDEHIERSFRNFGNVSVVAAKDVNPVDLLTFKHLVVIAPDETVTVFEKRIAPKDEKAATAVTT